VASTSQVVVFHGDAVSGSFTPTGGNEIRFKRADNDTADALNRVPLPTTGDNYSYAKTFGINFTKSPVTECSDLVFYVDNRDAGSPTGTLDARKDWTGLELLVWREAVYLGASATDENPVHYQAFINMETGEQPEGFDGYTGESYNAPLSVNQPLWVSPGTFLTSDTSEDFPGRGYGDIHTSGRAIYASGHFGAQMFVVCVLKVTSEAFPGLKVLRSLHYQWYEW